LYHRLSESLHVKAIGPILNRATSPLDRITVLTESLASRGAGVVERMPLYTFAHANFQEKFHGQLARHRDSNGQPFELLAASGLTPRGAVLVWTVAKCKEVNLRAWMANQRAFEVVCDSLKA